MLGPASIPPSTYYLQALHCCLLRKEIQPPPPIAEADDFGKIMLIYALHVHIFEWRQALSMLNPIGLMNAHGSSAYDEGEGLRSRRQWLFGSLDAYEECYLTPETHIVAFLLHQLAYISLYISISDLHLAAGRTGNKEDGEIAERCLEKWANSKDGNMTMVHVERLLKLSHHALESGLAASCSFEVAISFFTGGIVSWVFNKLGRNDNNSSQAGVVQEASKALKRMGCWRMCSIFGAILEEFVSDSNYQSHNN
jgi:hypothetical protein